MAIIGIIGTHYLTYAEVPFHENQVIYTRKGFVDVIQDLGHIPLIIPIDKPEKARDYIKLVDKVLLTGGEDVSPQLYGEEPHNYLGKTSLERDFFELAVIEAAIEENKPILGVCRGLQILNVKFGGSLYQDLRLSDSTLKHMQVPTKQEFPIHSISVDQTSPLNFLGEKYFVNSFHHQAIKKLANNFKPIAKASDDIIEAVIDQEKRILGIQWHPEVTWKNNSQDKKIFEYFLEKL
jgi:Predicted glutamine amidotransferases